MKKKVLMILFVVAILVIIVDQTSKIVVSNNVTSYIGDSHIGINVVTNTGMAFGYNEDNKNNIILSIIVLLIIGYFIKNQIENIDTKTIVVLGLAVGGGISNLIDRFTRGAVLDFIKFFSITFNIADVAVVVAWILIIIYLIKYTRKKDEEK